MAASEPPFNFKMNNITGTENKNMFIKHEISSRTTLQGRGFLITHFEK